MAIQMRRGQEVNFDADKMLPGEWAVSLDTRYVRMCFAPGVCVRMATYDAFEIDMAEIEAILAECQTIEEVVTRINAEVSANAEAVAEYTSQAKQYRDEAEEFRNQAEEIVGYGYASKEDAGIIRGGDNYIDENGTLVLTRTTTDRELTESQNGGIRIISMDGESQQNGTPTPEAPIDIDSVEISEIGSHGKNFFDRSSAVQGAEFWGSSFTLVTDNNVSVTKITVKPSTKYTASDIIGTSGAYIRFNYLDADENLISRTVIQPTQGNVVLTTPENCYGLQIALDNSTSQMMLAEGSVALPYEPYTETKETLSAPIVLRGIGDVKDVLCKQNCVYGMLRRFPEYIFSGTETLSLQSAGYVVLDASHLPYPSAKTNRIYCTHFRNVSGSELATCDYGVYLGNSINIRNKDFSTVDEYKNFFSNNDVKCVYESTPTFEPLPLADQIALHKLESFGGVTYLFTDSTIEPIIEVEYGTSKVGGYAIKGLNNSEISLLELEQLKTLTNELATQLVAGSEG